MKADNEKAKRIKRKVKTILKKFNYWNGKKKDSQSSKFGIACSGACQAACAPGDPCS